MTKRTAQQSGPVSISVSVVPRSFNGCLASNTPHRIPAGGSSNASESVHRLLSGKTRPHAYSMTGVRFWDSSLAVLEILASFPPSLKPAHSMFSVMLPPKDSLLLHRSVETMGSMTVRRVEGIWPPLALMYPHPDTRHNLPTAMEAPCRGSRAMET
ncbi:hypothetical protein EYF80_045099 [Liparis tanakae]|uniref:Uncharacterized protein n=1 Tax=Liparis tanakae TaxID=230148 RepID=A0A4Z2FTW6_9TELE|nr:hypothetical protein EYF80_045099 [Liparis tanakae]